MNSEKEETIQASTIVDKAQLDPRNYVVSFEEGELGFSFIDGVHRAISLPSFPMSVKERCYDAIEELLELHDLEYEDSNFLCMMITLGIGPLPPSLEEFRGLPLSFGPARPANMPRLLMQLFPGQLSMIPVSGVPHLMASDLPEVSSSMSPFMAKEMVRWRKKIDGTPAYVVKFETQTICYGPVIFETATKEPALYEVVGTTFHELDVKEKITEFPVAENPWQEVTSLPDDEPELILSVNGLDMKTKNEPTLELQAKNGVLYFRDDVVAVKNPELSDGLYEVTTNLVVVKKRLDRAKPARYSMLSTLRKSVKPYELTYIREAAQSQKRHKDRNLRISELDEKRYARGEISYASLAVGAPLGANGPMYDLVFGRRPLADYGVITEADPTKGMRWKDFIAAGNVTRRGETLRDVLIEMSQASVYLNNGCMIPLLTFPKSFIPTPKLCDDLETTIRIGLETHERAMIDDTPSCWDGGGGYDVLWSYENSTI